MTSSLSPQNIFTTNSALIHCRVGHFAIAEEVLAAGEPAGKTVANREAARRGPELLRS
ncbi:hypothetical protein [Streptomyces sp. NBC_00076]|uniref:hypothetical protein n=1 Tax=Streptomyces sp. NBC_00076 TaxID=2975642 RepID=UPI00324EC20B